MKFVWFRRFVSFKWKRGEIDKGEETFDSGSSGREKVFRKVVKFEDCEKINRSFVLEVMEETSVKNQYVAAVTGLLTLQLEALRSSVLVLQLTSSHLELVLR